MVNPSRRDDGKKRKRIYPILCPLCRAEHLKIQGHTWRCDECGAVFAYEDPLDYPKPQVLYSDIVKALKEMRRRGYAPKIP